jgi:hypothetical protein
MFARNFEMFATATYQRHCAPVTAMSLSAAGLRHLVFRSGGEFNATDRGGVMGHVQGSTFGVGTPTFQPQPGTSWGFSPYTGQPFGTQSFPQHYTQSLLNQPGYGVGSTQPLQQLLQFLQFVPQQVQQLQALQQQLAQIQPLLQYVPAQLQQLQQMIQFIPQQIQLLQQQPYGAAFSGAPNLGLTPQAFAGTGASYVM